MPTKWTRRTLDANVFSLQFSQLYDAKSSPMYLRIWPSVFGTQTLTESCLRRAQTRTLSLFCCIFGEIESDQTVGVVLHV